MSEIVDGGRWRVEVDQQTCIGSGLCAGSAPDHFALDEAAARPLADEIEPSDVVVDAADSCPVEAIKVSNAANGSVIAPSY